MANISSAAGTITAVGTPTQIKNWLILQGYFSQDGYGFFVADFEKAIEHVRKLKGDSKVEFTEEASGSGRWTLQGSNEYYFQWLYELITMENILPQSNRRNDLIQEYTNEHLLEMFKTLENNFKLVFKYADFEPGCDVFYKTEDELSLVISEDVLLSETDYEKHIKSQFKDFDKLLPSEKDEIEKKIKNYKPVETELATGEVFNLEVSATNLIENDLADPTITYSLSAEPNHGIADIIKDIHDQMNQDDIDNYFGNLQEALQDSNEKDLSPEEVFPFIYKNREKIAKKLADELDNKTYIMYDLYEAADEINQDVDIFVEIINEI